MACAEEKPAYLGRSFGMEQTTLTLDEIERVPPGHSKFGGVKIREFDDSTANPEPIVQDEEANHLLQEFLSPSKLRAVTGLSNLEDVDFLEMKVDTRENSLGNFGALLPNLLQLRLSNSIITSVRDLGTCLTNLKAIWLSRCGLNDLDGISSLSSLKELYLAFNHIEDVSPVSMLDQLEILDLEGNDVSDIAQVEFLCLCTSLKSLTLEGNPVCNAPHPDTPYSELVEYDYRAAIHKAVPNLKFLDEEPFLVETVGGKPVLRQPPASIRTRKVPDHLREDWQLVSESIKAVNVEEEQDNPYNVARPGSAAGRKERPSSARSRQRPGSASRQRPASAIGQRPVSAGGNAEPIGVYQQDDSSDLTHGSSQVICGNISRALKARRKDLKTPKIPAVTFLESPRLFTPEKSFEEESDSAAKQHDILEELKAWRTEYNKILSIERSTTSNKEHDEKLKSDGESPLQSPVGNDPVMKLSNFSPTLPTTSSRRHGNQSTVRRSLPTPPPSERIQNRPHSSVDFRVRRFRQLSGETEVNQLKLLALHGDESFDVDMNTSTPCLDSRPSLPLPTGGDVEPRSSSAPVRLNRPIRDVPVRDNNKSTKRAHRRILPTDPALLGQRPGTAAAALQKRKLRSPKES